MAEFCFSSDNLHVLLGDQSSCSQLLIFFRFCRCSCKYIENNLFAPCVFAAFVIRACMTGEDVSWVENEEDEEDSRENGFIKMLLSVMVKFGGALLCLSQSLPVTVFSSFIGILIKTVQFSPRAVAAVPSVLRCDILQN